MPAIDAHDEATLAFYAREAPVYAASGPGGASRHLAAFLDALPPGARILELGCGGGRDAEAMLARGFDVDPTDAVAEIAAQAEARIGRPVRILRFGDLDAEAAYDAVWAHASLLHAPWDALPDVLARIHRALRPGGRHFASYKTGEGGARDGFGRYFSYPSEADLLAAYRTAAPWTRLTSESYTSTGYDNRRGPWAAVRASR